jgi:hypothetical protein
MLKNMALLLAKRETGYGVDAVPTAAQNAILTELPEFEVMGKKLELADVKSFFGGRSVVNVGTGLKVSFTTAIRGCGAVPSTPPNIGVLFRGCNFDEAVDSTPGSESVTYTPNSKIDDADSLTLYFWQHNILHKMLGCRGSGPSVEAKAAEYGKSKWEFQGIYAGPVDQAIDVGTFPTSQPLVFKSAQVSIDGYSAAIESLKLDVKNEIAARSDANSPTGIVSYFVKERSVSGEIDPEAVALSSKNFFQMWENSQAVALAATIGQASGNRCRISCPGVQLDVPKYADRDNRLTMALPLVINPSPAGNDEVSFIFD